MYQIVNDTTKQVQQCVIRLSDSACIPFDPQNSDYAEYLKWLEAGNQPLPADEVPAQ